MRPGAATIIPPRRQTCGAITATSLADSPRCRPARAGTPAALTRCGCGVQSVEMRKPAFTETMQIGIVVRDLDAAVRRYVDDYGIGPWQFHQFKPDDVKEWRELGKPAKPSTRIATAMV